MVMISLTAGICIWDNIYIFCKTGQKLKMIAELQAQIRCRTFFTREFGPVASNERQ